MSEVQSAIAFAAAVIVVVLLLALAWLKRSLDAVVAQRLGESERSREAHNERLERELRSAIETSASPCGHSRTPASPGWARGQELPWLSSSAGRKPSASRRSTS